MIGNSSYRLESGETVNTDLTIIGGNATLDENSTVNGDVTVIGGNVTMDGKVERQCIRHGRVLSTWMTMPMLPATW